MNEQTKIAENPLGYAPIGKLLQQFAIPAVISMLVNAIYNIVDQIFIGQGVGYLGNAATTVAFPIVTIILAAGTCIGVGGSSYAAIKLGEKKDHEAEHTLGNVFILLTIIGFIILILGLLFLDPLLHLFGATDNIMDYSRSYTAILLIGSPFNMLGIGLSNMARTDGTPSLAMYSILAGALLNVVLDPIYIFIFHWGVAGAAIATVTSQIISMIILVAYFMKKGNMRLRKKYFSLDFRICKSMVTLGISSGITQLGTTILQIVLNNSLVYYGERSIVGGDVALSAMGIVSKINMILISICIGIGIGAQPILGFNKGANKPDRIRQTYIKAVTLSSAISIIGWALCMLFPELILKIFGSADDNFTNFAVKCMRVFLMGVFAAGFQIVSTSYFQATGQPAKASILSMLRQLIFLIPLILILPLYMGIDGILYAGPLAEFGATVIVALFMILEVKKLHKSTNNLKLNENFS